MKTMYNPNEMKELIVFYHGNCNDGFGAAWVAYKKFKSNASYIPIQHDSPLPADLRKKNIYFLDFCPGLEDIKRLHKEAAGLYVIDHHESVKEVIKNVPNKIYDLSHSGSVLAWQYFFPGQAIPKLLRHVEDKDLWNFKLSKTKEILAALDLEDHNFQTWNRFAKKLDNTGKRKDVIEQGKTILEYQRRVIGSLVGQADRVKFEGYEVLCVNSPVLNSEIGSALVKKMPPFGIIWYEQKGKIKVSLRSDSKLNVFKLAAKYGGGGHPGAAGFRIKGSKKPWQYL